MTIPVQPGSVFIVMRKHLFLLFIFGSGLAAAFGQSTFGSISGSVRDPQGALVPNASITLHREQSNTDRVLLSGPDGQYIALNLTPGTYTLRTSAAGFASYSAENIDLDARQHSVTTLP